MQDIGEPAIPEASAEIVPPTTVDSVSASNVESSTAPIVEETIPKLDGASAPETAAAKEKENEADRKTTTGVRKPLEVPSTVHVRIGSENLLEYVGPPIYQKDRLYSKTSPIGVSCGLGYLGNGSGAVMPIEVTVRACPLLLCFCKMVAD